MSEAEPRYECPVCLGIKLKKVRLSRDLVLDACPRCGGIWFDYQELHALREVRPKTLWKHVAPKQDPHLMKCHSCQASMDVNAAKCEACGWTNEIDCPVCSQQMKQYTELDLDVCKQCKGVWFDNADLSRIWNGQLDKHASKELARHRESDKSRDTVPLFLDVLAVDPIGTYFIADVAVEVAGTAAGAAGEVVSNAPAMAGAGV